MQCGAQGVQVQSRGEELAQGDEDGGPRVLGFSMVPHDLGSGGKLGLRAFWSLRTVKAAEVVLGFGGGLLALSSATGVGCAYSFLSLTLPWLWLCSGK